MDDPPFCIHCSGFSEFKICEKLENVSFESNQNFNLKIFLIQFFVFLFSPNLDSTNNHTGHNFTFSIPRRNKKLGS